MALTQGKLQSFLSCDLCATLREQIAIEAEMKRHRFAAAAKLTKTEVTDCCYAGSRFVFMKLPRAFKRAANVGDTSTELFIQPGKSCCAELCLYRASAWNIRSVSSISTALTNLRE